MGSDALVVCVGGDEPELAARARARILDLEHRWSRFVPDSEICLVNASAGQAVPVSTVTLDVVVAAVDAWRLTDGRFDPTLLRVLEESGYDRSFELLDRVGSTTDAEHGDDAGRMDLAGTVNGDRPGGAGGQLSRAGRQLTDAPVGLRIDEDAGSISVEPGVGIDLGGIGKGRAADLAVGDLLHAGADGACVDLGGDVRVAGRPADGEDGWVIGVADPAADNDVADLAIRLADGAVATSTRCRRRWVSGGRPAHHLIDPGTGRSAAGDLDTVTVVAADAGWAEVIAKAALIAGSVDGADLVVRSGVAALFRGADGELRRIGAFESFEVPLPCSTSTSTAPAVGALPGGDRP